MANGYGQMIREARESIGMTVEQLAERLGRAPSTVRRIEAEGVEPSVAQVNILVAALPLSAERLLQAMGVHLSTGMAGDIPPQALRTLRRMTPQQLSAFLLLFAPEEASQRRGSVSAP